MNLYKDYFGIRPDYAPIMTRENIEKSADTWLAFYPHDSFIGILRTLLKGLNGGNKTLWITGAYGTGKSHASLVLQKLFNDDEARVQKWIHACSAEIPSPVQDGILALRKKTVLVVYDVNSDGVDSKNQFLMRLQRGVSKALEKNGLVIPLKGKLNEVIERIRQDEKHFFIKRDEMQAQLSYLNGSIRTIDQLSEKLRGEDPDVGLISDAMRVLEARNIYLDLNVEEFLGWVSSTLEINNVSKIVYIWDEFSAFVERNRSELKTLEQLAEAAQQGQFYFVPVTHMEISSYVAEGSESAKKLNDRFWFNRLDLPNETALKLAAKAFVEVEEKKEDWTLDRDSLWHSVKGVAESYMATRESGIDPADFKGILPLHPMAAFLLKHLSVAIGSNQRSMFEFLSGEEFQSFIEKGGLDISAHQFLTVDHLWSYFVERDDLGTAKPVQEARAEYARREKELQPDEKRVFKTVLLFGLIEQIQGSGHPLLSATTENIQRCFEGDGALQGVDAILNNLEEKHCFSIIKGRCERFQDRIDSKEVEDKKSALESKFNELVLRDTQTELSKQFSGINFGSRFDVRAAGVSALSKSNIFKRESFSKTGNKVLVQFVLARDESEQLQIPEKVKGLVSQFHDHRMIFVTLPTVSFCRDNTNAWEEFTENSARLALADDNASKRVFETQISSAKAQWFTDVMTASKLTVYKTNPNGKPFSEDVLWGQLKREWLLTYVKQAFEYYTDDLGGANISAFGSLGNLANWALAGIDFDRHTTQGRFKTVVKSWQQHGVNGEDGWFSANQNHPLSKMNDFCKKRLENTVGAGNNCSIRKLYIDLQRPPFGLLSVPHSAFVLGFVLKTWLSGKRKLQWTDSVTSKPLDEAMLAEIIGVVVKDDGQNKIKAEKQVCRLSKEEKAFIKQSKIIFGDGPFEDGTVESTLTFINSRLESESQRVPIWVLPHYIETLNDPNFESISKVIDALCKANSISSKGDTEARTANVKIIGEILLQTSGLAEAISSYIDPITFEKAFLQYVDDVKPELKMVAGRIGYSSHNYCEAVKKRFAETSSWLWKEGDTESVLDEIYWQMLVIEHTINLIGTSTILTFEDAFTALKHAVFVINKVPLEFWIKNCPALKSFFDFLSGESVFELNLKAVSDLLGQEKETIRRVFFDVKQTEQLGAMRKIFGELWPKATLDSQELYNLFPSDLVTESEQHFISRGRITIEEYNKKLISKQLAQLWVNRTNTTSPDEWSRINSLPAECLLTVNNAQGQIEAIEKPERVSAEHLKIVYSELSRDDAFVDVEAAGKNFFKRVFPNRYVGMDYSLVKLIEWLKLRLGDCPNRWLANEQLREEVETFIEDGYNTYVRKQAEDKVKMLSDSDAKQLLLNLINRFPDVGFSVLR